MRDVVKYHLLRQLAILAIGLVVVLVVAGQLARADAGPSPIDPEDSLPAWASDGVRVAFERQIPGSTRIFSMTSQGRTQASLVQAASCAAMSRAARACSCRPTPGRS